MPYVPHEFYREHCPVCLSTNASCEAWCTYESALDLSGVTVPRGYTPWLEELPWWRRAWAWVLSRLPRKSVWVIPRRPTHRPTASRGTKITRRRTYPMPDVVPPLETPDANA